MTTVIKTRIVKIGNSRGIRIPKLLLEQAGFGGEVELALQDDQIVLRPVRQVRRDWDQAFQAMAECQDDVLLDGGVVTTMWDEEAWEW